MKAPENGAFPSSVRKEPAIYQALQAQGSEDCTDVTPLRIERMLKAVFTNEEKVSLWEKLSSVLTGRRYVKPPGEDRPRYVIAKEELVKARSNRDNHLGDVHHTIDYALTTDAYEDVPCAVCKPWRLPKAPLAFIRAVAVAEKPVAVRALCKKCKGRGVVRQRKTDAESKVAFKRISYFNRVLGTAACCAKIRYGSSDQDDAYRELEQKSARLLVKFRRETQTTLEQDDAEQGVRMGIVDAAKRFDPCRPEGADFGTVAYNWAYRNSRARNKASPEGRRSDDRPGVYAPSIDSWVADEDGSKLTDQLRSSTGALASFAPSCADPILALDMRREIDRLPGKQRKLLTALLEGEPLPKAAKRLRIKMIKAKQLRDDAFASLRRAMADYVDVIHD